MSRIGKKPVAIPSGVDVSVHGATIKVKGPKGELSMDLVDSITAEVEGDALVLKRASESKQVRAFHGMCRSRAGSLVEGVTQGFQKVLSVQGVGYRADVRGKQLVMNLGFSHPIEYAIPDGIQIEVSKDNKITVSGIDKAQVGQVAADIRAYRSPDRYKGKGVRYLDERIILKAGKSG